MSSKPNILLFGAGSVGTVYLYLLSKTSNVTAVCRSNFDTVSSNGFTINSSIFRQGIHFRPNVVRTCEEAAQTGVEYDYVVICAKAIPDLKIPSKIRPAVTEGKTAIVLIQNGIGIEGEYWRAFPHNPIVSCVVYLPASQTEPGVVQHGEVELLEVGGYGLGKPEIRSSAAARAQEFAELVQAGGGTAKWYEDVQAKRWTKLLVNASWNPICALTLSSDVEFMLSSTDPGESGSSRHKWHNKTPSTDLVRNIMLEIADIATAYGYPISEADVDFQLSRAMARIPQRQDVRPSMLQDVRAGRRIEVDAIVGNVVLMGRVQGVKCDRLEMLSLLAGALDSALSRKTSH